MSEGDLTTPKPLYRWIGAAWVHVGWHARLWASDQGWVVWKIT